MILIPYVAMNLYFYSTAESIIKEKIISSMAKAMQQTNLNIEELVSKTVIGANMIASQDEVLDFMTRSGYIDYKDKYRVRIALYELIQNVQSNILPSDSNILLIGYNGSVYTTSILDDNAAQLLTSSEWFERARSRRLFYSWYQLTGQDLCLINSPKAEYMVMCRVIQDNRGRDCGMAVISFKRDRIYDLLDGLTSSAMESYFITTGDGGVILTSPNLRSMDSLPAEYAEVLDHSSGYFTLKKEAEQYLVNYQDVSMLDWKIAVQSPYGFIFSEIYAMRERIIILNVIILVLFGALILCLFNRFLQPVHSMINLIHTVEKGDLSKRMEITASDELGILGRHLNEMQTNLGMLLEENYEKQQQLAMQEKEKETMRYLVLQSQINPHFLFNTLNNIKWLAQINHDKQVADSISSLGHLLEGSIRNMDDEIPLEQEIDYLKDYLEIMELSRPGKFETRYEIDERAKPCLIPKLILQPLVENAIIHGLDSASELGQLTIRGTIRARNLVVEVIDNGVGFDKERVDNILRKKISMNRLGVKNTDQRIKLTYGEEYGLKIIPAQPRGTRVLVTLPAILSKKEGERPHV